METSRIIWPCTFHPQSWCLNLSLSLMSTLTHKCTRHGCKAYIINTYTVCINKFLVSSVDLTTNCTARLCWCHNSWHWQACAQAWVDSVHECLGDSLLDYMLPCMVFHNNMHKQSQSAAHKHYNTNATLCYIKTQSLQLTLASSFEFTQHINKAWRKF